MNIPEFFTVRNAQVWVTGSNMYGMNTPDSDVDLTGVFHSHLDYMDPFQDRMLTETAENNDYSVHTAAKFAKMLVKGNFNAIDLVFHDPVVEEPFVKGMLSVARPYVLTRNVASSYMGYVMSQKDRLVGHKPRSPERTAQVERLGYDPKYASHLLRGMYTLYNILETGEYFYLTDELKVHLRNVKSGVFVKPQVEEEIESFVPKLEACYNARRGELHEPGVLQSELVEYFIFSR
jgi:predicted nucleotidyltransferase